MHLKQLAYQAGGVTIDSEGLILDDQVPGSIEPMRNSRERRNGITCY